MKTLYRIENLVFRYGLCPVLQNLTAEFRAGEMTAVVGPNGAGKSTLMGVLAGVLEGYEGSCRFLNAETSQWRKRDLARLAAFIPQTIRIEFPFTAEQVVFMGRTPHCRGLFETEADREAVERAMELTDSARFRGRSFRELSGGERQRVVLASALAQEPEALLLDEPTTFLDLKHQIALYSLLRRLAREGTGVIAVTHDLNLASAYSDRLLVLDKGRIAADGAPGEVLRPELLRTVFETDAAVTSGPSGRPWLTYG